MLLPLCFSSEATDAVVLLALGVGPRSTVYNLVRFGRRQLAREPLRHPLVRPSTGRSSFTGIARYIEGMISELSSQAGV